jgi:hypothetical protein
MQKFLTDDLLKDTHSGHCYVASEVIYHVLGGKKVGLKPMNVKHNGVSHWFLIVRHTGDVIDPTAEQFDEPVNYENARGRGFLTKQPSKRALEVIKRAGLGVELDERRK